MHVASDDNRDLVLVEKGLHGAHGRLRLPLALMSEVGVVPGAVRHDYDPWGECAIGRLQILSVRKQ